MSGTHPREERAMGFDDVSRTWTRLGEEDPMWAVLTDAEKSGGRWQVEDFLSTGVVEIEAVLARLHELGVSPSRDRALDFGCGAGRLSHGLARAGFEEVLGLDISPTMLASARRTVDAPACRFEQVTGADLAGVETDSVDLAYSCRVLQHMPPPLAQAYIREFHRVVRSGGVVVFQLPTGPALTPAGFALRLLPGPVAIRLRRGMEMHGTPEADVRDLVEGLGARVLTADPDTSAGPRWRSRLYVTATAC
ncbi:class I SAM-dependent methyltransferase [Actinomycetospora cinnamomea]|uniref:Methyltransferase family protein n=1 Tax=Actinomycetospora cinnamomea TaxID=663609 RepID=A0A2U1FBL1_9PSEU|nr:class I SAM-dependent methyltransferase [Actinomycetospora cinnamomea]PVZ09546.1 methyltransferase family protein [Actinomycetospora cinnamomea]